MRHQASQPLSVSVPWTWGIRTAVHLACGTGAFDFLDLDSHVLIGQPPPYLGFQQDGETLTVEG